jgi:chemotaxis signal transduction protein
MPMRELLVVIIAGERRALPMERVVEVRVHCGSTFLPGAPPWVRGFVTLHGRPVEVFDAARRLGLGELRLDARSSVIFAESAAGYAGMLVDGVEGIVADGGELAVIEPDVFFTEAVA